MRRFWAFLLSLVMICGVCFTHLGTSYASAEEDEEIRIPKSWVRGGVFLLRSAGFYSESVRFLSYAFGDVSHVTYGETSVLARKLSQSKQLQEILEDALEQGLAECRGVASFYDGSDLEFSIGAAEYTMRIEDNRAIFVLKDTYDFTEIRDSGSISDLLNNLGHKWQEEGTITPYNWLVKVIIPLEEVQ